MAKHDTAPIGSSDVKRALMRSSAMRIVTLIVSGLPTLVAWALISRATSSAQFASLALALSIPTVLNFVVSGSGADIANAAASGRPAFQSAVERSVRANLVLGASLVFAIGGFCIAADAPRLLGLNGDVSFEKSLMLTGLTSGLWLPLLTGDRMLIALGRTDLRVIANGLSGPVALIATCGLLYVAPAPQWLLVLPFSLAALVSAAVSLLFVRQQQAPSVRLALRSAFRAGRSTPTASVAIWLVVVDAFLTLPIWLIRPVVSARSGEEAVVQLSLALQFSAPFLSVLAIMAQSLWPYFAKNREAMRRRSFLRNWFLYLGASMIIGLGAGVTLFSLQHFSLLGHDIGLNVILAAVLFVGLRGAWGPVRVLFAAPRTGKLLLSIVIAVNSAVMVLLWFAAVDPALALLLVASAYLGLSVTAITLLFSRIRA